MKFWNHKYRRTISSGILFCYLTVITLGILHHHEFDLNKPVAFNSAKPVSGFLNNDITSDFDCVIQQNISHIQNFTFSFNISLNYYIQNVENLSLVESNKLPSVYFSFPNQLRAPPSYS